MLMSVTIDREPLAVRELGLQTVGQVLAHVAKDNRLVVQVLIDGQEPDIEAIRDGARHADRLADDFHRDRHSAEWRSACWIKWSISKFGRAIEAECGRASSTGADQ